METRDESKPIPVRVRSAPGGYLGRIAPVLSRSKVHGALRSVCQSFSRRYQADCFLLRSQSDYEEKYMLLESLCPGRSTVRHWWNVTDRKILCPVNSISQITTRDETKENRPRREGLEKAECHPWSGNPQSEKRSRFHSYPECATSGNARSLWRIHSEP